MDNKFDPRRLRVSVEVDGQMKIYEGLQIHVTGEKNAGLAENTCKIELINLNRETRNYLLTETSPFNKNRTRKRVIVEAGRQSMGLTRVFVGDVTTASPTQPPDIGLSLEAKTGYWLKGNLVARSGEAQEQLSSLSKKVADDTGLELEFQATDKRISNYSFTGGTLRQVDKIGQAGNIDAFVDDDLLVVKDVGKPRKNRKRILRKDTGLIGVPEVTEHGVKVKFLFDNETVVGGQIAIESELNPSVSGSYEVYKLAFDLTSRDTPWYYIAEARRI